MDNDFWKVFWEKLRKIYEKEDGNDKAFDSEQPILGKALKAIQTNLKDIYEFVEPIGRGGAGVVVQLKDKRLLLDRALKVPRPKEERLIESVRNEIKYLKTIRHQNIINIYDLGEVEITEDHLNYPYFVMDFIEDVKNLRDKLLYFLSKAEESKSIEGIMRWILEKFHLIAGAIQFLHDLEIIHFDIKPSNILIDKSDKPVLSDLGFAKKKLKEDISTVVGFTAFYAHPDLSHEYNHMSSKNRVRKQITTKDLKYTWDIYAFGKSLLEILSLVDSKFPDTVMYDYIFVYLHLMACRMLDGRNLTQKEMELLRQKQIQNGTAISIYKENWLDLEAREFDQIKYTTFKEIELDFYKQRIGKHFLESVPEVNSFYPKRIQSSEGIPAPFSYRVKRLVEHPITLRLIYVPQLGLLNYVYPTATHNRYEHSLGTLRNSCLYVQSLYNDPYNLLFKQLVSEKDIKAILIASLLHDLGQFPLAHEMTEISREFKHENFTIEFLNNPQKDDNGHSLKDIIEDEDWGWGVGLEKVKEILRAGKEYKIGKEQKDMFEKPSLKIRMLSSIIDGPIDSDKLDYLLRDSQRCYLKYGESIDVDRLIRNLTVIITKDDHNNKYLTLGTYEKGQPAAESLTFARYLLYQALYWHHTERGVRAMLKEVVKPALE